MLIFSVKRGRKGEPKFQKSKGKPNAEVDESSPVIQAFREYQTELDSRHDKHERLVKLSRDVTIESKRIIFLLHRYSRCIHYSPYIKFQ